MRRWPIITAGCSDGYVHLESVLGKASPEMDDASDQNISRLKDAGADFISEHAEKLDKIV